MVKLNTKVNNNLNYQKVLDKKMNNDLSSQLMKIVDRLKTRVEREVPDKGYFRNFAENFDKDYKSELFCKNISLFVHRDEQKDGRAYLGISVLHPTMNRHVYSYIMNGNREDILDYISDKNFIKEFEDLVLDYSESLKNEL